MGHVFNEKGQNQISVDHKSFINIMASVWARLPRECDCELVQPDLRKVFSASKNETSAKPLRRSSVARLIANCDANGTSSVAEEGSENNDMQKKDSPLWIPAADAFDDGLTLAKKSLENHVLPNFLVSPEFRVYKKRCTEAEVLLKSGQASALLLSSGITSFVGLGDKRLPILPTTSLLDDKELSEQLIIGRLVISLDIILSDRYLFQRFFDFLQKRYCPETLLCYRSLQLFRLMFRDWASEHGGKVNSPDESTDSPIERLSWTIAMYFLTHGSDVEVPVHLTKTYYSHLSYRMAKPTVNMFSKVERACYDALKSELLPDFFASRKIHQVL